MMHPTPDQLLLRLAVDKALMTKQRKVWEWYNYDRLTHAEIAKKLRISREAVTQQIRTIEKQLGKWCLEHKEIYNLLTEAMPKDSL